jgi:hypothetical protein
VYRVGSEELKLERRKIKMEKIRTTVYLYKLIYEQLRLKAFETKMSQSAIIEKALTAYLEYLEQKTNNAGD